MKLYLHITQHIKPRQLPKILRFRRGRWTILSIAACLMAAPFFAAPHAAAASDTGSADAVKRGRRIFHERCAGCHNQKPGDSMPFGPPNLYTSFRGASAITSHQAETIIRNGEGTMPAFGPVLSQSDIRLVIAYLRSR